MNRAPLSLRVPFPEGQVIIRRILAACLAASLFIPGLAAAADGPPVPAVWKSWPNKWTLKPFTPEKAARFGVGGWALVDCLVAANGRLTDCNAWATSNDDFGFSHAAQRLADMRPLALDVAAPGMDQLVGKPVRFAVIFPVDFTDYRPMQKGEPKPPPPLCFPKDDGSVPIISTPQYAEPSAPIRRC